MLIGALCATEGKSFHEGVTLFIDPIKRDTSVRDVAPWCRDITFTGCGDVPHLAAAVCMPGTTVAAVSASISAPLQTSGVMLTEYRALVRDQLSEYGVNQCRFRAGSAWEKS